MAKQNIAQLTDDLDGTTDGTVRTVRFSLDGVAYEIDLNDDHAHELRGRLAEFLASARLTREPTHLIRLWANENGYQVTDRGRIPVAVMAAYDAGGRSSRTRPG